MGEQIIAGMPESLLRSTVTDYFRICAAIAMSIPEYGSSATLSLLYEHDIADSTYKRLNVVLNFDEYIGYESLNYTEDEFRNALIWCKTLWSDLINDWHNKSGALDRLETEYRQKKQTDNSKQVDTTKNGYIYLLRAITPNRYYKIGLSTDPIKRIEILEVKLPFPIEPLHQFPTNHRYKAEKMLHNRYADKRVNGEWFALSEQDVADICAIERMDIEGVAS